MFLGLSDPHPDPLDKGTDPRIINTIIIVIFVLKTSILAFNRR
jgi:hypothetical protein